MLRNTLFRKCEQLTVNSVKTGFTIYLPTCFKEVDDVNTFIQSLGKKAEYLDQQEITRLYNTWSPQNQKKFIWEEGIKPGQKNTLEPK